MGTLSFAVTNKAWSWNGTVSINYETEYNKDANTTTVTFKESKFTYWGRSGYGTSASVDISVQAADNTASKGTAQMATYGNTTGSSKDFPATPSPTSVTVQHSDADGEKSIVLSATALVKAYMSSSATSQTEGTGNGSVTVETGTRESNGIIHIDNGASYDMFLLYIDNGNTWEQLALYIGNGNAFEMLN